MDAEYDFAPWNPSKVHILVSTPDMVYFVYFSRGSGSHLEEKVRQGHAHMEAVRNAVWPYLFAEGIWATE